MSSSTTYSGVSRRAETGSLIYNSPSRDISSHISPRASAGFAAHDLPSVGADPHSPQPKIQTASPKPFSRELARAKQAAAQTPTSFVARNWKPVGRRENSLQGYFELETPDYVLRDLSLHGKNGKRWIGLPVKTRHEKGGIRTSTRILEFKDREKYTQFQTAALAAVDAMLAELSEVTR